MGAETMYNQMLVTDIRVSDGKLTFKCEDRETGKISNPQSEAYRIFSTVLRMYILNMELPHARVIGARVQTTNSSNSSYIDKLRGTNISYANLLTACDNLVFNVGDYDGCVTRMLACKQNVESSNGSLVIAGDIKREYGVLVSDVKIARIAKDVDFYLYLYKGTGLIDFAEAEQILGREGIELARPMRAIYDLSNILTVAMYLEDSQDCYVRLCYKTKVNEQVLQRIISECFEGQSLGELYMREGGVL